MARGHFMASMNAATHSPELATRSRTLGRAIVLLVSLALAACGESPMAPQQPAIDRVAAARVVPAVTDSRARLALGVENTVVRARIVHDLTELEDALMNGDGQKARFHVRVLGTVISDYRAQQGSTTTDGADVTGIMLMLHAVNQIVDAGFTLPLSL